MTDLHALAEAATPGPWVGWADIIRAPMADDRMVCEQAYGADFDYLLAVSPDRILALLDMKATWRRRALLLSHYLTVLRDESYQKQVRIEALLDRLAALE